MLGFAIYRPILRGAVLACALSALTMTAALADTLKVDNGDPECSDIEGDPYCTIQSAIDDASPGDRIKVDDGIMPYGPIVIATEDLKLRGKSDPIIDASGMAGQSAVRITADGVSLTYYSIGTVCGINCRQTKRPLPRR